MKTIQKSEKSGKKLPIGKSDFKAVIEDNCYYVDKTHFIMEITAIGTGTVAGRREHHKTGV